MNWIIIIWTMVVTACLTLAVIHLFIWCANRGAWSNLLFSLSAVTAAVMAVCEVIAMRAETVEQYAAVLRWSHVPFFVLLFSLVGFVLLYMRAGRLWLAWAICILRTLSLLLNFAYSPNINFREITALKKVHLFGETVSVAVGSPNPWMLVGQLSIFLFLLFLVDATVTLWRRKERLSLIVLSSTMFLFMAVSLGQYVVALWGFHPLPFTSSIYFLGIVLIMALEMSREAVRAVRLTNDLSERDEWLGLAAESAGIGLWLWNIRTNLVWATDRARNLYGLSLEEPITYESFFCRLHPDDHGRVVRTSHECLQEGPHFHSEHRVVLPNDAVRWCRAQAKTFFNSAGVPVRMTGVSIDITEQRHIAMELEQKRNEMAHLNRIHTMGQLSTTLAHELNQPLGAILRNAEAAEIILREQSPDLDELRDIMADICKDNQRAGKVIMRMQSIMRNRRIQKKLLDLCQLTDEVIALVRPDAEKRQVQLEQHVKAALPPVHGDRVLLQQVLINLLINAMDALEGNHPRERIVQISAQPVGAMVEMIIFDTGSGIAIDQIERTFEPFFTTKEGGLGMGLAISRGIIEAHGGHIHARNNDGSSGASFIIVLPAAGGGVMQ